MNRLEVWVADIQSFGVISSALLDLLDPDEELRARQITRIADRRRFLLSRMLLRKALSAILGGEARDWQFTIAETGKVSLAAHHGLPLTDFSISHSDNAVVVAISTAGQVGLDIEQMSPGIFKDATLRETLSSALTERELRYLESRSPDTRWRQALQIWTIKEAYSKLLGKGVYVDFTDFEILPSPWRVIHRAGPGGALHIETHEIVIGEESYHLALTARPSEKDVPFAQVRVVDSSTIDVVEAPAPQVTGKISCGLTSVSWLFSPKLDQAAHA